MLYLQFIMSRLPRIVVAHAPHHVTQRGNRREPIFFEDGDQDVYRDLLAEQALKSHIEVWAYCLMPNHVHLIVVPSDEVGLGRAIGETHRRYTNFINARSRWSGHLFQSRFASVVMDEAHLLAGVKYVSLNPVRARLVPQAEDWPWSSVRAHLQRRDDGLVIVKPVLDRVGDFANFLAPGPGDDAAFTAIRLSEGSGRPLANAEFIAGLEQLLGRAIARRAPGSKAKAKTLSQESLPFGD
jgi:putative transposase